MSMTHYFAIGIPLGALIVIATIFWCAYRNVWWMIEDSGPPWPIVGLFAGAAMVLLWPLAVLSIAAWALGVRFRQRVERQRKRLAERQQQDAEIDALLKQEKVLP
jgi:membrane protein implicated in regulation of membrane protease activity